MTTKTIMISTMQPNNDNNGDVMTTKTIKMMSAMMIIFNICLIFFFFIYFTVSNDKGRPIFSTLKLTHPISLCKNYPDIPIFLQVNSSPHTISTILIITIFKKIIISLYFKTVYQLTKLLPFFIIDFSIIIIPRGIFIMVSTSSI